MWYNDHMNLSHLLGFLIETGREPDDIVYFLGRPDKYEEEWKELLTTQGRNDG